MIDRAHPLPVTQHCQVSPFARSSLYAVPQPIAAEDVAAMRQLDLLHLQHPFAGSRMLRDLLRLTGVGVGRKHVAMLMRRMGIMALCQHPRFIARLWKSVTHDDVYLDTYDSVTDGRLGRAHYFTFYNRGPYYPTSLCARKREGTLSIEWYCGGLPVLSALHEGRHGVSSQRRLLKDPRALREGMLGGALAALDREPERPRAQPHDGRGFRQIQPTLRHPRLPVIARDLVMAPQGRDALLRPAVALSGLEPIAVQDPRDQLVGTDPGKTRDGVDDRRRGLVAVLTPSSSRYPQLGVHPARPVEHERDHARRAVDVDQHFLEEGPDDPLLQADIRAGSCQIASSRVASSANASRVGGGCSGPRPAVWDAIRASSSWTRWSAKFHRCSSSPATRRFSGSVASYCRWARSAA